MKNRSLACLLALLVAAASIAGPKGKKKDVDIKNFTFNWQKDLPAVWYDETPGVFDKALKADLKDVKEVVFAVRANGRDWHWYANFGYNIIRDQNFYHGGRGGRLCALNLRTKEVRVLLQDEQGDIRDPAVSYDGKTVLFAYRKGDTKEFHLYTIQADGTELKQITNGAYNDFEPCWLPDGGIMFVSSRCMRWVPCWYSQVAIMYRCEADGSKLHPVSFGVENENTPWPMQNGRVLYTRWEYVDRSQTAYHGLWTINPDGTAVALFYDNLGTSNLYISAKPVPNSDKIVSIITPGHGRNEQRGRIGLIDPSYGPDCEKAVRFLDNGYPEKTAEKKKGHVGEESWRDPYPISDNCYLTVSKTHMAVMDGSGAYEFIYKLPPDSDKSWNLHEPRPLVGRKREPVIPHVTPSKDGMATMMVMDVTVGRNMKGIKKGQIKDLVIMEELPRPASNCAYADAISSGPNYVLHRILGKVPVEPDGSAHFKAPAGRALFFYALDDKGIAAKAMSSYISAMPGEIVGCVGCHEDKMQSPVSQYKQVTSAMQRPPSQIEPIKGVPEIFDYVRDIQPIWDKHCIKCHNYEKFAGKLLLTGDMTASWSVSYRMLKSNRLVSNKPGSNPDPYSVASGNSKLIKTLMGGHHGVKISELELEKIKRWADSGTTFAGTYASLGSVSRDKKISLKGFDDVKAAFEKRCASCHKGQRKRTWLEGENRGVAHRYNMTDPGRSLILLAPLAKEAGGLGICNNKKRKYKKFKAPVFQSKDDPDFQTLVKFIAKVREQFGQPRWFQKGFVPRPWYTREMKRFGALPESFDPTKTQLNGYEADRKYFNNIYRTCPGPQPKD